MYHLLFANRSIITVIAMVLMFSGFFLGPFVGKKLGNRKLAVSTVVMFLFGGMFFGIGINPAKGAPQGSPGMVYCGLALLIAGFLILIIAALAHKMKALKSEEGKNKLGKIVIIGALIIVVLGIVIAFVSSPSSDEPVSSPKTCQACDREFTDSTNKSSISRTNMCSNCYNNYKTMEQFIGQ